MLQASPYQGPGQSRPLKEMYLARLSKLASSSDSTSATSQCQFEIKSGILVQRMRTTQSEEDQDYDSDQSVCLDDSDDSNVSNHHREPFNKTQRKWLLFCFQHYEIDSRALHIRLGRHISDEKLFRCLRKQYFAHKVRPWMRYLGLTRFVPYLTDYNVKKISFVQFRLWPGRHNGMPKKEEALKPPFGWKSGEDWEPNPQNDDIPELPDEFFLCHWKHPEEKYSRLLYAIKLSLGEYIAQMFPNVNNERWKKVATKWPSRRQCSPDDDARVEEGTTSSPDSMDDECRIITVAESQGIKKPRSIFLLPLYPKKIKKKLKDDALKPPYGWGLFVEEQKKRFSVPFLLSLAIFFVNLGAFTYVMHTSKWPLGSMFFSGSSLAWAIVVFFIE